MASLERGEPELTSALAKYEKGVVLLTQCHRLLDQAEQSVALLTGVDDEGNPLTTLDKKNHKKKVNVYARQGYTSPKPSNGN